MKKKLIISIFFTIMFLNQNIYAKESNYFLQGKEYFSNNDLDKSKILFEKDLVFNPKSEQSYLYLAKIFQKKENIEETEVNLNNVLLINPKNDEAIYMLVNVKIDQSNYNEAEKLINKFNLVCKSFCSKREEIESKLKKIKPENEKSNN